MSEHNKPSDNYVSSSTTKSLLTQTQNSSPSTSTKKSVIIDSEQNIITSSVVENAKSITNAQQILNSNNQSQLSETTNLQIGTITDVTSSNNKRVEFDREGLEKAVDFFNLDKDSPINNSWKLTSTNKSNILRDCSDSSSRNQHTVYHPSELKASDSRLNISPALTHQSSNSNYNDSLIDIGDNNKRALKSATTTTRPSQTTTQSFSLVTQSKSIDNFNKQPRAKFESLLVSDSELNSAANGTKLSVSNTKTTGSLGTSNSFLCDSSSSGIILDRDDDDGLYKSRSESQVLLDDPLNNEIHSEEVNLNEEDEEELNEEQIDKRHRKQSLRFSEDYLNDRSKSPSYFKRFQRSFSRRLLHRFNTSFVGTILTDSSELDLRDSSDHPYTKYEDKDLLTGASKYNNGKRKLNTGRTFRGTYKYTRAKISMAIFKKLFHLVVQRSTLSLLGAFLIHVTLGTVYTLSNINSYLTSYMRQHGSPNATYGGSMWISSLYAVGQGFSMVLGGYIEKRFSARVACFLGCALHSMSIISTSLSIDHGPFAVLFTYGFIPGFGCGLAYMTPMSNGFGWFPNRKGLVAGVILAGFGIGTFIFNMAQTAYVNPENLSPPDDANGYFTQHSILDKVPHLFVFIGTIYASMQFIGCCLLFKPPNGHASGKGTDERPILVETEMPLKRSIRRREFLVLFLVYGITTQGVLFVNAMIKEYGQIFIGNDMYLAWTGSMASIANSLGRLVWGLAIDRFSFTQCFTSITIIFASLMFIMPFEFVLSSKLLYLLCTLGIFGSFSGWMSTYPVHLSRVFGRTNSGMIYGLIFISQSIGGIATALGAHYLIDHYNRFVPFFCVVFLEIVGLSIYHLFYPK